MIERAPTRMTETIDVNTSESSVSPRSTRSPTGHLVHGAGPLIQTTFRAAHILASKLRDEMLEAGEQEALDQMIAAARGMHVSAKVKIGRWTCGDAMLVLIVAVSAGARFRGYRRPRTAMNPGFRG